MGKTLSLILALLVMCSSAMAQTVSLAWDLSESDALLGTGGGYHIYQSKQSGAYTTPIATVAPGVNTTTFATGALGKLYWVATAFTSDGTESLYSNEVNDTIKPKPPKLNTVQQVALAIVKAPVKAVSKVAGLFKSHKQLRLVSVGG